MPPTNAVAWKPFDAAPVLVASPFPVEPEELEDLRAAPGGAHQEKHERGGHGGHRPDGSPLEHLEARAVLQGSGDGTDGDEDPDGDRRVDPSQNAALPHEGLQLRFRSVLRRVHPTPPSPHHGLAPASILLVHVACPILAIDGLRKEAEEADEVPRRHDPEEVGGEVSEEESPGGRARPGRGRRQRKWDQEDEIRHGDAPRREREGEGRARPRSSSLS
jgi:hypothetical protein